MIHVSTNWCTCYELEAAHQQNPTCHCYTVKSRDTSQQHKLRYLLQLAQPLCHSTRQRQQHQQLLWFLSLSRAAATAAAVWGRTSSNSLPPPETAQLTAKEFTKNMTSYYSAAYYYYLVLLLRTIYWLKLTFLLKYYSV